MEELFNQIITAFDFKLMISITMLSYITLKLIDKVVAKTHKILKHSITIVLTLILSFCYYKFLNMPLEKVIPTYLLSTAFYDVIINQIVSKFKVGYKK